MAAKTTKASPPKRTKTTTRATKNGSAKTNGASGSSNGSSNGASDGMAAARSTTGSSTTASSATAPARRSRARSAGSTTARSRKPLSPGQVFLPRAMTGLDDDDVLMAHGGGGTGFGRCGGRMLSNRLEQQLCQRLGIAGVVHSHSPRHYEIRFADDKVAAYAPMIVLRGRGREGKGVVIEAIEDPKAAILRKVVAFREQYGQEFYVILVANDEVLDEVPLSAYDESCASTYVSTLIARLAE